MAIDCPIDLIARRYSDQDTLPSSIVGEFIKCAESLYKIDTIRFFRYRIFVEICWRSVRVL